MIRKEQDNIRPAPSSSDSDSDSSRHSSESSQDSDDPVQVKCLLLHIYFAYFTQTIASQSSTAGCVTQKIIKREDQDDMMSLASSPSHHNSSQDVLLHSDVPAYSTQISMASQSGTRHVKTEKEEPIPSSSSCHNSSRAEDDQQLPEPQASPGLELSQDKVDAHNTKCSICLSERIKGIRYVRQLTLCSIISQSFRRSAWSAPTLTLVLLASSETVPLNCAFLTVVSEWLVLSILTTRLPRSELWNMLYLSLSFLFRTFQSLFIGT